MSQPFSRKLKVIEFTLLAVRFECQLNDWKVVNNTEDGERFYTFCSPAGGEFREEAEPDYALELKFFSDWRLNGISDFLWAHDQETASVQIIHHPDLPAEKVQFTGSLKIKAPSVGGEARTTEMTEVTLPVIGKPIYTRL